MSEIDINDLASIGAVRDVPAHMLPPEAWTRALNMRPVDTRMQTLLGWGQVFSGNPVPIWFAMPLSTSAQTFWLLMAEFKGYVWDGSSYTDITRSPGGNYAPALVRNWNGTLLGGVPILNNGIDVPQFWATASIGTRLADLTNWPSTLRAKVIRSFGPFLMAFNCTKSGTNFPHMVKWSHPADPGSVPVSWDETDATRDTGEKDLEDVDSGIILDAMRLGEQMMIYKETSTWRARFIGGRFIFDFKPAFEGMGILAPRCVTTVSMKEGSSQHFLATQDDVVAHNGTSARSLLDKRQRRRFQDELDVQNFVNSFVFNNPVYREVWVCYPSTGETVPNRAFVINYSKDPYVVTEVDGITFQNGTVGNIEEASDVTWAASTGTWADDPDSWSTLERRRVVLCSPQNSKLYLLDETNQRDGVAFSSLLEREALAVSGQKRNGEWINDFQQMKMVDRFWPKIVGGPVNLRMGKSEVVEGPVAWNDAVVFDPSAAVFADLGVPISGRAISWSIQAQVPWGIDGYKMNQIMLGQF